MARVALYANSKPRFATYLPVLKEVALLGHDVTLYHSGSIAPTAEEVGRLSDLNIKPANESDVKNLSGVDVFISSEKAASAIPKNAKSVAIVHSLPDRNLLQTSYHNWLRMHPEISKFDYLFIPVKQKKKDWSADLYKQHLAQGGVLQEFTVVPGGYPKLEYLREALGGAANLDSVIYCPTNSDNAASGVSRFGSSIIKSLHDALGDRNIVFRPYPTDSEDLIRKIASECEPLPRFILDQSATGIAHQRRALFTVTDKSSSSITFSIASGRPAIFVSNNPAEDGAVEKIEIGYKASGIDALVSCAVELNKNHKLFKESIDKFASSRIFNLFEASNYIAKNINVFATGGCLDDWLSVPRN